MKIDGIHYRTIWVAEDGWSVEVIDQTKLPHVFATLRLRTADDAARAIKDMVVRGAPLIGATAAYGLCLALRDDASDAALHEAYRMLAATRPTAINLKWALDEMIEAVTPHGPGGRVEAAYARAAKICDDDVEICRQIGVQGLKLIRGLSEQKPGKTVNVLTHCNAGWLACVDWGTA
ncbi:MAG TPA: S-methyl-5-thioribose-1-phosphate isomerase, partial [Parvibaculum sp.]